MYFVQGTCGEDRCVFSCLLGISLDEDDVQARPVQISSSFSPSSSILSLCGGG